MQSHRPELPEGAVLMPQWTAVGSNMAVSVVAMPVLGCRLASMEHVLIAELASIWDLALAVRHVASHILQDHAHCRFVDGFYEKCC